MKLTSIKYSDTDNYVVTAELDSVPMTIYYDIREDSEDKPFMVIDSVTNASGELLEFDDSDETSIIEQLADDWGPTARWWEEGEEYE